MTTLEIRSPLPGTFYRRASPEAPEFKKDGEAVGADDTVGLVEVMKTFHEVPAGVTGSSIKYLVEDADAAGAIKSDPDGLAVVFAATEIADEFRALVFTGNDFARAFP